MHHLYFSPDVLTAYPVCFLVPTIRREEIKKAYIDPFMLDKNEVLVLDLHYAPGKKKTPVAEMKAYFEEALVSVLENMHVEYLVVADAEYFKMLTKSVKVDVNLGYVLDCVFGPWKVVYVPNFKQIFYDPEKVTAKISQGMTALIEHKAGAYTAPGHQVLKFEAYPKTDDEIRDWLNKLLDMNCPLAIDIEGFGLKHYNCGLGTISFAWSKHEGIAFPIDYVPIETLNDKGEICAPYGKQVRNEFRRGLLRWFFSQFVQRALYHQITFDVKVLIYQLYMDTLIDTEGLLKGLDLLMGNWDCTKLIAYLATNSCAGNKLGLKEQAQEFAGNYAMDDADIKDITRIPLDKLLTYNLVDSCSTWFVYEKRWPTLVADDQLNFYDTIFKPAAVDIIQMQLTGLPVNMDRVIEVKALMVVDEQAAIKKIRESDIGQQFTSQLNEKWVEKKNATLKVKRVTLADAKEEFNPNSDDQKRDLLYGMLGLPVIAFTPSREASTKADVLKDLKHQTEDPKILDFIDALLDLMTVSKLLTTFIPAMEGAQLGPDGWHYLFGSFNLGGTISGRLSSSEPNLQNLPAGADPSTKKGLYGKWIKSCVEAPPGWVFGGLDFDSLEDKISGLTTRDPNKLKVYIDGYDGHSLRAHAYYTEQMPDIDGTSVASINSIQTKYKALRSKSKNPTFTLTYQGNWQTLVNKYKFPPILAKTVEARYHELYKVSDQWVSDKLDAASRDGYVTVAFGLRVRTPLLAQVVRGTSKTPSEAEAEGRSAGNALGQSYCLLNTRAWIEFMVGVRKSKHRLAIRPCAQIHDAGYALFRDDAKVMAYANKHLVKAVQWQESPDIAHDQVKLSGSLGVFWPTWANEITLPNGATEEEIPSIIEKAVNQ